MSRKGEWLTLATYLLMLSITNSMALYGLDGFLVSVETDISRGLPKVEIVGLPDNAVREAKERVRSAIKNSGFSFPSALITVNLAPADLKKEGASLDLAIAVGILRASEPTCVADVSKTAFFGELSLDGRVRPISGVMPLILSGKALGYNRFVVPIDNCNEARYISDVEIVGVNSLCEVVDLLKNLPYKTFELAEFKPENESNYTSDICYVKGQEVTKRALEVAVSGGHNILMVGAPGSGKTMLAKCIPSIMPSMSFEEALETTKIHSVAGTLKGEGIVSVRPFMTPHHTATDVALIGGGSNLKPGLISLAHNGVLYLDEMPEYSRSALECLRQPLEDRIITISRAKGNVKYPASFMLCASMNPCPCGNFGSEKRECHCSESQIRKYKNKISGPLLDRIDIQVQVDGIEYDDLMKENSSETSEVVRNRVNNARKIQYLRFKDDNITTNAEMGESQLAKYCPLDSECEKLMRTSFERLGLSARARSRLIKVARTIADLDGSEKIKVNHLYEAVSYRNSEVNS